MRPIQVVRSGGSMDASLGSLVGRLDHLSDEFRELRDGVQKAIQIADADPEMALTRARKVLEYVVRDVYERRIKEPPGTRPLENLLQRLVKDGFFPDRLDAYANTIRKLGNIGTHTFDEKIAVADVFQSLTQLMPIIEWYFEIERPGSLDGKIAQQPRPAQAQDRPKEPPPPVAGRLTVVPKGLRSFDAHDADFFLDLLPGPRDKDGLPESIGFWMHRIENQDEATFTVGLIYGPSGCGKSSLVKAGLLPRLSGDVISVHVEATADETESRLLHGLRKRCPSVNQEVGLKDALAALHRNQGGQAGKKVLIIIDQFEQWLHAKRSDESTELLEALRQCDGGKVQCIAMVRDDFWMAVTRFFRDLDIPLVEGQNFKAVDLFPLWHARQVLAAFGRAYGGLPAETGNGSGDHKHFLDQATAGLAEDGKVICVRLALFAEMMKGRPWTPATLKAVGGTEGVGVTFLEETFSAATAPPEHRYHQQAARAVLKALLPESGTNIKGHMRSYGELLEASGYADRPKDFADLIRILDSDIRLITPTDPEGKEGADGPTPTVRAGEKYYQLTHDYLVPSLREWLTRKQRETRKGRAELRLAQRSTLWNAKPENQQLPSFWAFLSIRLLTDNQHWTGPQRKMMRQAGRVQGIRSGIVAVMMMAIVFAAWEMTGRFQAASLVEQIMDADIAQVPGIVEKLDGYRHWADPLLTEEFKQAKPGSPAKLHAALALLPVDAGQVNYLRDQLLVVTPERFPVVRDALLPRKAEVIEPLWLLALDSKRETRPRFQAACALASYAPDDQRWGQIGTLAAGYLVSQQASDFLAWREALRPAKQQLIKPLGLIFRDAAQKEQPRTYATETLADYASGLPEVLVNLLADAEQFQFQVIFDGLAAHQSRATALAETELAKRVGEKTSEDEKVASARRQANLATALLRMGKNDDVWPLLQFSPDPRVRSYLIHWLGPLGSDPQAIVRRWQAESDATIRRALTLALGEFTDTQLPVAQRQLLIEELLIAFENESDAGLHGAVEWLLRKWNQGSRLQAVQQKLQSHEEQLQARKTADKRQWYVNNQGQTFVILDADTFEMGSPASEPGRSDDETQHRRHIGRRYAIASTEVTKEQFGRFQAQQPKVARIKTDLWAKTDDSPQTEMTWFEAVWYCNWLSVQEGIPEKQWCYEPAAQQDKQTAEYGSGMKAKDNYLQLAGYRLPTEAEWEYACRARVATSRYYGPTVTLLSNYAWPLENGENRTWPVSRLKPNDLGLFDMHGNAIEWCDDPYRRYPDADGRMSEDSGTTSPVVEGDRRVLRGGAYFNPPVTVRSAFRNFDTPSTRYGLIGFRPARTYP
jgi:formylglycine-generating enzyme required for sulfatase activity